MKALFYQIRVSLCIKIWPSVACARLVGHRASVYAVPLEVNFDPLWPVPAIAGCLTTAASHLTRSHGNPMRLNRGLVGRSHWAHGAFGSWPAFPRPVNSACCTFEIHHRGEAAWKSGVSSSCGDSDRVLSVLSAQRLWV